MTLEEDICYSKRVIDAVALTYELHNAQRRKGSGCPYITHLFAVASIVGEYHGTEDQVIAALLHDAVEDQGGLDTLTRIREAFGDYVAQLVWECSDSHEQPRPPWQARKEAHIAAVASANPDLRLIVAADKLHNARSIERDLRQEPAEDVWKRFQGGRKGSLWYLRSMYAALKQDWAHPILDELELELSRLVRLGEDNAEPG